MRKEIIYCDFGTYCDFSISNQLITRLLESNFQVCYSTSDNNPFLKHKHPHLQVETYPSVPVLEIVPFAEMKNIISQLLKPSSTIHTIGLLSKQLETFQMIFEIIVKNFDPDSTKAIILTYPLTCVLKKLASVIPENVPLVLFYVTPAFPNVHLPWIFDDVLKDPDFSLYRYQNRKQHLSSHTRNNWSISVCVDWKNIFTPFYIPNDYRDLKKKLVRQQIPNLFIVGAWNKDLIPSFLSPVSVPRSHWKIVNAIVDQHSEPLPSVVQNFVRDGILVFMTFGSMNVPNIKSLVYVVYRALQQQDIPMKLLVQGNKKQLRIHSKQNLLIYQGNISYSSILSKTRLLITTGSYCIQHLALLFRVPMLFVPILTEQYFWAKNYQYHTDTPYLEKVEDITNTKAHVENVAKLISFALKNQSSPWLKKQQHHLEKYNGTRQFVSFLEKIL